MTDHLVACQGYDNNLSDPAFCTFLDPIGAGAARSLVGSRTDRGYIRHARIPGTQKLRNRAEGGIISFKV